MGHPGLDRVGVQDAAGAADQVVGVERLAGDVEGCALVVQRLAHDRVVGPAAERGLHRILDVRSRNCCTVGVSHAVTSANSFSSSSPSIAVR